MESGRAAKRRKIEEPTVPPPRKTAAATVAELRWSSSRRTRSPIKALRNEAHRLGQDTNGINGHGQDSCKAVSRHQGAQDGSDEHETALAADTPDGMVSAGREQAVRPSRRSMSRQFHVGNGDYGATHQLIEDCAMNDADAEDISGRLSTEERTATPERRTSTSNRRKSYPSTPASTRIKAKTLEDEIKEIEDQSRRHVGDDDAETPRSLRTRQRQPPVLLNGTTPLKVLHTPRRRKQPNGSAVKAYTPASARVRQRSPSIASSGPEDIVMGEDDHFQAQGSSLAPLRQATSPSPELNEDLDILPSQDAIPAADLIKLQSILLGNLTGNTPRPIIGLGDEYAKIANLIQQTIIAGESNSMIVIGARGGGKSAVLDHILQAQRARQGDSFLVVRLCGFIHTDDKIALREIWRQLGKEMDVEDDSAMRNYADTLTTLLALLSHPSELVELGEQEAGHVAKSVIFILDEFELFASHARQTLLYNLFDIAQSRKAPIAVLGLTTRFDVSESLEKRVKSRFSHRQVHLPLARNFALFRDMCKSALTLDDNVEDVGLEDSRAKWHATMDTLFTTSAPFTRHLQSIYYTTKSVPDFHTSMLMPLGTLHDTTTKHDRVTPAAILAHIAASLSGLAAPDSKLALLPTLSTLQLALLVAAARLSLIHDSDNCSFALAYDEYKALASKARVQASASGALAAGTAARVWDKEVAGHAWEGLVGLGLVMPVREGRDAVVRVDVGLEEIGASGVEMGAVMARWCREI